MYCPICGNQIPDNSVVCPVCNQLVTYQADPNQFGTPPKAPSKVLGILGTIFGALGIPLAILIACFGYIFGGASLVLSIIGKSKNHEDKLALVGIILGALAIVVALINSIAGVILYSSLL
ncbi:MAG: zinc ribbon domain-containing protein [Clostridia bacterium]|nr:zinc ribbon domain-containing protein [Clostridia bacterium]